MDFAVENTGFANPIRPQKAELILEKDGEYIVTDAGLDSRTWRSCTVSEEKLTAQLPDFLEPGEWNVYLRLSVGEQDIPDANLRCVQFANPGIWNSSLGANKLGSITLTKGSGTSQTFRVKGTDGGSAQLYTVNGIIIPDGTRSSESEWTDSALAAENGENKLYLSCDDQYLYVAAEIFQNAASPVYNLRIQHGDKSYWWYATASSTTPRATTRASRLPRGRISRSGAFPSGMSWSCTPG